MAGQTIIDRDGTKRPVQLHGPEAFAAMRTAGPAGGETLDFITPLVRRASPRANSID